MAAFLVSSSHETFGKENRRFGGGLSQNQSLLGSYFSENGSTRGVLINDTALIQSMVYRSSQRYIPCTLF